MSFDRPGLPLPGHELDPEVDETLREEGVELTNHEVDAPEHPGDVSAGPQPNHPLHPAPETHETDEADGSGDS